MGAATMNMKKLITIGALTSIFVVKAWGSVFFTVDVGSLQDENGVALVDKGMLYLISSGPDGEFSLPTPGSVTGGGDDAIIAFWDLSAEASTGGEYIVSSGEVAYDGAWAQGDNLAILWFPDLTLANQSPVASEPFGFYRNTSVSGGGDAWELPEDGTLLHSLKFFTEGDNPLVNGSDVPALLAAAGLGVGDSAGPPTGPSSVATNEDNPGTVKFEWNGASAPGGAYRIERKLAGGSDWTVLGIVEEGTTSYDDPSVGRGKEYDYRLVAINGFDAVLSSVSTIESLRSSLHNIATRGIIGGGDNVLIVGFTVEGTGDITLLTRTKGPALAVEFPTLSTAGDPVAYFQLGAPNQQSNDNWGDDQFSEIQALLAPRTNALPIADENSKDAAMVVTLNGTSLNTIISTDTEAKEALGLVEIFDATEALPNDATNRIVNLSTRGFIGTGDNILIGGFIVKGQVSSKLLIRGVGPSLALESFNGPVAGHITDTSIILIPPGAAVEDWITNDDWEDEGNSAEIVAVSDAVGATNFETGSKDSAILIDADPGLYTFFLTGVEGGTGIGLIEVFLAD